MAINVSALPEYVNQHTDELLTKAVLGATTLDYISIMPQVKYKDALTYLSSTVTFQDASTCGWNPAGNDVLSQRTIEVRLLSIMSFFSRLVVRNFLSRKNSWTVTLPLSM